MPATPARSFPWLILIVIFAGVVMAAQGLWVQHQQGIEQDRRDREIECLSKWSISFAGALDARTGASTADAQRAHDNALDQIMLLFLKAVNDPTVTNDDLKPKLVAFQQAQIALEKARNNNKNVQADNPYPDPPTNCIK